MKARIGTKEVKLCRILAVIVVSVLTFNLFNVYGYENTDADLENIIISVKEKVGIDDQGDVPFPMTEMDITSLSSDNYGKTYSIRWSDRFDYEYIEVSCNENAEIINYMHFGKASSDKDESISYDDAAMFADSFLHKIAPELFANENDCLVRTESKEEKNADDVSVIYKRSFNGIPVENNNASVTVSKSDDELYVRYAYINYDYDAVFKTDFASIENYEEAYMKAFPLELIYKNVGSVYKNQNDYTVSTALVYRFTDDKCGYILAEDGSIATTDADVYYKRNESMSTSESAADSAGGGGSLSAAEIAEIDKIEGLISKEKALEIIKNVPGIKIDDEQELTNSEIRKRSDDDFVLTLFFNNNNDGDYKYASADFDAKSSMLIGFGSQYRYGDEEASEEEKASAEKNIEDFLRYVIPEEFEMLTEASESVQKNIISKRYDRLVNDIRYIDDGVIVKFDTSDNRIVYYGYDFEKNSLFDEPEEIINLDNAYGAMLKINPVKLVYAKINDKYEPCYTVDDKNMSVDAFSGDKYVREGLSGQYNYEDIDGHWAENAIRALSEKGIVLYNDDEADKNFYPDNEMTQKEVLRLFAAGVWYTDYLNYDVFKLYNRMLSREIIEKKKVSAVAAVSRMDAFKYLVRMDGTEDIALLSGIFTTNYEDRNDIPQNEEGYVAVLSGMGVLKGDCGTVRPNDRITRAEAATLLYNYIVSK